jgi:hypothetical protein
MSSTLVIEGVPGGSGEIPAAVAEVPVPIAAPEAPGVGEDSHNPEDAAATAAQAQQTIEAAPAGEGGDESGAGCTQPTFLSILLPP